LAAILANGWCWSTLILSLCFVNNPKLFFLLLFIMQRFIFLSSLRSVFFVKLVQATKLDLAVAQEHVKTLETKMELLNLELQVLAADSER
jgi:hypothetical protein